MTIKTDIDPAALTRIAEALERVSPPPAPTPSFAEATAYIWHPDPDRLEATEIGRLIGRIATIRQLSLLINRRLGAGHEVGGLAPIMKDLGTALEQEIPEVARRILAVRPFDEADPTGGALATAILGAPSFTLRGGTREILRGIIAREMGLR